MTLSTLTKTFCRQIIIKHALTIPRANFHISRRNIRHQFVHTKHSEEHFTVHCEDGPFRIDFAECPYVTEWMPPSFKSICRFLSTHSSVPVKMKVEALLIDLSGTIHIEDTAIPGAVKALQRLRHSNLKLKFVTNTTKESKRALQDRLDKLGFGIKRDEIFTSLTAARQLVEQKQVRPLLFLEDSAKEDFEGVNTDDPNAVVIGLAPSSFNYEPLNEAFRLLINGADLIAIHKARYYRTKEGLNLGPGLFVTGLEYATDKKAEVVGKPEKTFFLEALRDLGCKPENTVMIGDDARDDVFGAMEAGMMGILVQTGKYREGDEDKVAVPPLTTCKDFPAAVDYILNLEES